MSSRCLKCGLSDNMERTDEVADQSACRESDQSVNQESVKGVKDYFERIFTDRKKSPRKKMEENADLENYLDCENSSSDPMQFWRENQSRLPRLAVIAKQTFCAPGSTAAVERIFSIAGYILSQRRTRINDDNFQNQLFANVNMTFQRFLAKG